MLGTVLASTRVSLCHLGQENWNLLIKKKIKWSETVPHDDRLGPEYDRKFKILKVYPPLPPRQGVIRSKSELNKHKGRELGVPPLPQPYVSLIFRKQNVTSQQESLRWPSRVTWQLPYQLFLKLWKKNAKVSVCPQMFKGRDESLWISRE